MSNNIAQPASKRLRKHGNRSRENEGNVLRAGRSASQTNDSHFVAYFAGSAQPNSGRGGIGWVIKDATTLNPVRKGGKQAVISNVSEVTSNQAEYVALIQVLRECISLRAKSVVFKGDSAVVILQMTGVYKVASENLQTLHSEARKLSRRIAHVQYEAILREENTEAQAVAFHYSSPSNHGLKNKPKARKRNQKQKSNLSGTENFSAEWLSALAYGAHNIDYLSLLLKVLEEIKIEQYRFPPRQPPLTRETCNAHMENTSANNFSFPQVNVVPVVTAGRNVQVRYLLKQAQCGLAEAYRTAARAEEKSRNWNMVAFYWALAYNILHRALQEIDDWRALKLDYEANRSRNHPFACFGHDLNELNILHENMMLVEEDTERARNTAWVIMNDRRENIELELNILREQRNRARARIGNERWCNNPNPKMGSSTLRMIELATETKLLQQTIHIVDSLELR
jgi:ribonuclease HI